MFSLPVALQQKWENYLAVEGRGKREDRLQQLQLFIDELLQLPLEQRNAWAIGFVDQALNQPDSYPLRMPLFENVLFPALADALDAQQPGSARRLAGLNQLIYRSFGCRERLGDDRCTELALLRLAVAQDPTDQQSRQQLIRLVADRLQFSLHEVPAGVLYGMDGATVEECDELLEELGEFRQLLSNEPDANECSQLVADCDFHFRAYQKFLQKRAEFDSYASFLQSVERK